MQFPSVLLFAGISHAAVLTLCSGFHGRDANDKLYTGNVYTLFIDQIDNSEIGAICGKYASWIKLEAAKNKVRVGAINCQTKPGSEMNIKVSLDKQSPGRQEQVLMKAGQDAFQSFGQDAHCSCAGC